MNDHDLAAFDDCFVPDEEFLFREESRTEEDPQALHKDEAKKILQETPTPRLFLPKEESRLSSIVFRSTRRN